MHSVIEAESPCLVEKISLLVLFQRMKIVEITISLSIPEFIIVLSV